jgi:prepilin-type N-terminal cleavage/methylation domain-containing protein
LTKYKFSFDFHKQKAFSLFEMLFAIVIIVVLSSATIAKRDTSTNLYRATNKLLIYLSYTRYISFIDNKYDPFDSEYKKKFWTLKFLRCDEDIGGLYFVVYSDNDGGTAHFKKADCLKDPTNDKYLYSNGCQKDTLNDKSKYILLTKEYGIVDIEVSCNTTSAIGQISFGNDGTIYSQLGNNIKQITDTCYIILTDKHNKTSTIAVEPTTGYVHISRNDFE